ncbi:MAG: hypothetical protein HC877_11490 [Thioploca sp.]|nr:hypothetical protein [Thioploca sp.]
METDKRASEYEIIVPDTPKWQAAIKDLQSAGRKKNYRVAHQHVALQLLKSARGDLPWKETYTAEPYIYGYEIHPNESHTQHVPHHDLPHIKWKDWRAGKRYGATGHIFFDEG